MHLKVPKCNTKYPKVQKSTKKPQKKYQKITKMYQKYLFLPLWLFCSQVCRPTNVWDPSLPVFPKSGPK